tara:strand:- start:3349 stop:3681 length:333 start_codon:yes stop_codon:yes gene_type:complete
VTTVFDGMAGVMAKAFGAPVIYTPKSGESVAVRAMLREGPIEVAGDDGRAVLILSPTLQVPKNVLPDIARGDLVAAVSAPDKVYLVLNRLPNGSPAADAMLICELERVED